MKERKYPVASTAPKLTGVRIERTLSDGELFVEVEMADRIEDEAWREEWLGRVRAEIERRGL